MQSASACLPELRGQLEGHDAVLIACYSAHPLVGLLQQHQRSQPDLERTHLSIPVVGIFQASLTTALHLLSPTSSFGIVSTGKVWETLLSTAMAEFLSGNDKSTGSPSLFAGVQTTGLDALQLHEMPVSLVQQAMKEATKRLLLSDDTTRNKGSTRRVEVVCLGCAGMSGLHAMVREACVDVRGETEGRKVRIVDGVLAGIGILQGLIRLDRAA